MNHRILGLTVRNFRTLTDTKLPLGPLTVMVGPNAAGKSNVLHALEFLGEVTRKDIEPALEERGGFDVLAFRGGRRPVSRITVGFEGIWSDFASEDAPDRYELSVSRTRLPDESRERYTTYRREHFTQHPAEHTETVVELASGSLTLRSTLAAEGGSEPVAVGRMASALHNASLLPTDDGPSAVAVGAVRRHLAQIRVFDPDVRKARQPSPITDAAQHLHSDAANLADFLKTLRDLRGDEGERVAWEALLEDVRTVVPQIRDIHLVDAPGRAGHIAVELEEEGLRGRTPLTEASWGTVRILCMLAIFHDPEPPLLTCIEEIDHGIHPHALSLLAGRLREASTRSQFLVTTHSPVFVNDLEPEEFVVCERRRSGASLIPARRPEDTQRVIEKSEYEPMGDLWYSGALGVACESEACAGPSAVGDRGGRGR
ncbi:AAA family ATPase [Streptomyces endophytica]|uniref:AAA family ATPase n=1 Tax=Streptomyces endophytica TaxID=2991496 RepID=A0ABY6PKB7_9ACTN|nr:AAA family ATPase [Streptomyces endophytica]UZJ33835.1 AAA family ATPase [Streptomyces endophytica]